MNTTLIDFLKKQYTDVLLPQAEKIEYPYVNGLRQIVQKMKEGHLKPMVAGVLELMYDLRRKVNYPIDFEKSDAVSKTLGAPSDKMEERGNNNWFFRIPKIWQDQISKGAVERLVVNASPEKEMIPKLDDFCVKNCCIYKVPNPYFFNERLDTVIVYAYKPLSKEAKDEFVKMMSPYIRREKPALTNALDGDRLADGIFSAREPSSNDVKELKENVEKHYPPEVSEGVETFISGDKMSLGMQCVVKDFLAVYDESFSKEGRTQNSLKINIPVSIKNFHLRDGR